MKKYLLSIILFVLFLFSCQTLSASSCAERYVPLFIEYARADAVFIGKLKRIKLIETPEGREGYYERWRSVEFEVQKVYKGFDSSTKRISLFYVTYSLDDEIDDFEKNQTWIIFAGDLFGQSGFRTECTATEEIEKDSDIAELEKEMFSVEDNQAIVGRLYDELTFGFIEDIEVILEGNGTKIVKATDDKECFIFPSISPENIELR